MALAKDRTSDATRPKTGGAGASRNGKGGRTRPPANVVAPQRPWGLIAAAVAVVVFAVAVIGYAVVQVNKANENKVESIDEIDGITTAEYEAGQHVGTTVAYTESPPIGGEHDPVWADCTGTVYDVDIRHENAVHSLEHGAVWITYDPDVVTGDALQTLRDLASESGRMVSPNPGQDSPISLQSWNHQLKVDSADDPRIQQFADFFTYNQEFYPEPGASCENPQFISDPLTVGDSSRGAGSMTTDSPTTPTAGAQTGAP
jgi:hypothetical protein